MQFHGKLSILPRQIRLLIAAFVITLNLGFFTGLNFVDKTTQLSTKGVIENYLGNEADEQAEVMKFKKSHKEILTLVHNHVLSLSIIFLLMGGLLSITRLKPKLKSFLMIEPFFSIVFTFGGIYLIWMEVTWFKYIVILSGSLMTICFLWASLAIIKECFSPKIIQETP